MEHRLVVALVNGWGGKPAGGQAEGDLVEQAAVVRDTVGRWLHHRSRRAGGGQ